MTLNGRLRYSRARLSASRAKLGEKIVGRTSARARASSPHRLPRSRNPLSKNTTTANGKRPLSLPAPSLWRRLPPCSHKFIVDSMAVVRTTRTGVGINVAGAVKAPLHVGAAAADSGGGAKFRNRLNDMPRSASVLVEGKSNTVMVSGDGSGDEGHVNGLVLGAVPKFGGSPSYWIVSQRGAGSQKKGGLGDGTLNLGWSDSVQVRQTRRQATSGVLSDVRRQNEDARMHDCSVPQHERRTLPPTVQHSPLF